jgi:hypothetical protein
MENSVLLQNVTLADIEQIVSRAVKKEVAAIISDFKQPENKPSALVPRKHAASRLKVSLTTLDSWAKAGIVHPVRKGGRVFYRESELIK